MIEVWQRMYFDKQSEESVLESAMGNSKLPTGFVGDGSSRQRVEAACIQ